MTQDQIQRLDIIIRYENDKIHVALIADIPDPGPRVVTHL